MSLHELDRIFYSMYTIGPLFLWGGAAVLLLAIFKLFKKKKGIGLLVLGIILLIIGFILMEISTSGF